MSKLNVFILGATGFIEATAFDLMYVKHPEYDYTALVRSQEKAVALVTRYPLLRMVVGDLTILELIELEAENANIVISIAQSG